MRLAPGVLILLPVRYPGGSAAANRIQKIARALHEAGGVARIIAVGSAGEETRPGQWLRDEFSIDYRLICIRPPGSRRMRMPGVFGESRLALEVDACLRHGLIDCVFLYGQSWLEYSRVIRCCERRRVPVVADCTEWHALKWADWNVKFWVDQNLFRILLLRRNSGVVAISRFWERYAGKLGKSALLLPALGETFGEPEQESVPVPKGDREIVYVGALAQRDLPLTLVEGLKIARAKGLPVRLCLIGKPIEGEAWRDLQRLLQEDAGIRPHVEITGWVSEFELKTRMLRATALVLLRPDSRETRACFPTRLPEYLLTGKPVIISNVGDVSLYLTHGQDAWLLPPGNQPLALAEAIALVIGDPARARGIGNAGKRVAIAQFGYISHSHRLAQFFLRIANVGAGREII